MSELHPVLDVAFYRGHYPDLAALTDDQVWDHYARHGKAEGRLASPYAERSGLIALAGQADRKLEIGPFAAPALTGEGVRYLDVLDADQLRERATAIGLDPSRCPALVHYVGDIDQVTERFDAVLSSHCIEHQPDLVRHLNGVAAILDRGGRYYLMIPDKRFCFDHFIAESTVAQVVDAHLAGRTLHSLASVVEHYALTTHNDPGRHWRGDHGVQPGIHDVDRVSAALEVFRQKAGTYIDVHAWYFTPDSFRRLIGCLASLGLIRLRVTTVCGTPFDRHEFCAILEHAEAT